jgi:ATP-dependent RNA helicase DHX37/DHR1
MDRERRSEATYIVVQGKSSRAVRYQSCRLETELYLHPRSFLQKTAPDYLVYLALTRTEKRTYMGTVTAVDAAWLAEACPGVADISGPSPEVKASYNVKRDCVVAWCHVAYGIHRWQLPMHARAILPCKQPHRSGYFYFPLFCYL